MFAGARVSVVVPAHDESGLVGDVVRTIPPFVDRVFVVDDGSTDGTWAEVRRAAGEVNVDEATADAEVPSPELAADSGRTDGGCPPRTRVAPGDDTVRDDGELPAHGDAFENRVVPVKHETNRGRGAAVKTGYRLALADGSDVIAVMDGDGQMDPDNLARVVGPVARGDADYAKGDRLCGPRWWAGMSRFRLFGNGLLSLLTRAASGYWRLRDPQNGYTAIGAEVLREVDLDGLYDGYGFLNDVLVVLGASRFRVTEVPMRARYGEEASGIRYASFVPSLSLLLLRRFVWRVALASPPAVRAPLVTCYSVGLLSTALAGVKALWSAALPTSATAPHLLLVGVVALLAAIAVDGRSGGALEIRPTASEPE